MKRGIFVILFISILLVSPLIQAQTYSGFNRFTDDVQMFFASGDNKVKLALEIREKEIDSAIENSQNQNEEAAIQNLERAHKKLKVVREKISLDVVDEVEESVNEIVNKIKGEEGLSDNFEVYILEEKKTQLVAGLTKEIFEMCKKLAKEDYTLMLQEEQCNPKTAPEWLKEELKELKRLQRELFVKLMLDIRSCMDDPGTCNCEDVSDVDEQAQCEKMISLAVRCEYKDDQEACDQMIALRPPAESFVPDFLMNLFRDKEDMIEYGIEHSDGVPKECWNENTKPECEQYRHLKETSTKCWDAEGNWDEEECGGPKEEKMTMQESIPQCYDLDDNFLETKCGIITMVENEDGLINYIIETEIDNVIEEFEDSYEQHTIDVNGSLGQTAVWEVEGEIGEINEEIREWVIDQEVMDVEGDEGLTWEIKTDIAGEGTGGLKPEVETDFDDGEDTGDGAENIILENGEDDSDNVVSSRGGGMTSGTSTDDTIVGDDVD
jgi:hypothetical protein